MVGNGRDAPKDETALAVIGGKTRGLGSSGKQASCLEIEGLKTAPKTGAPNDRQGHQSVTPAIDRGHDDPPAQPQDSVPVYPPCQKVCRFPGPVCRQGHRRGCPSLSVMAGLERDVGGNRQRQRHCPAVLLQGHTATPRSCRGAHLEPRPRRLPVVLSPQEVGRLLAAATNIKHRTILSLAYATGLRASEVVSLKLTDIDRNRMVIRVEQGKGKKDRYAILSPILLEILHEWWRVARKKGWMSAGQPWLFPGYRGQHTSARQLHRIVRLAAGRAGITKRVGVHTLRHCFATHLLDRKSDIRIIQVLLGHKKLDTTALYTRVAIHTTGQVTSPLDFLRKIPG